MCGIAGSNNKDRAYLLYQSNLDRGYYSSGSIVLDDLGMWVCEKTQGKFRDLAEPACVPGIHTEGLYYLYHSRGPTTETKEFNELNNHPFFFGDWIVAHNGIISNFVQLGKEYFSKENFEGRTDSCIIPRVLDMFGLQGLSKLEGTLAIWAYNIRTKNTYIARNSCTLYANVENGDFCSTMFNNSQMLDEGSIYRINNNSSIVKEYTFKTKSPYFIL
jgi:glucosamine 6-phosphate synthetase-like amidotransferase/phosphosugar isomerase protein